MPEHHPPSHSASDASRSKVGAIGGGIAGLLALIGGAVYYFSPSNPSAPPSQSAPSNPEDAKKGDKTPPTAPELPAPPAKTKPAPPPNDPG